MRVRVTVGEALRLRVGEPLAENIALCDAERPPVGEVPVERQAEGEPVTTATLPPALPPPLLLLLLLQPSLPPHYC